MIHDPRATYQQEVYAILEKYELCTKFKLEFNHSSSFMQAHILAVYSRELSLAWDTVMIALNWMKCNTKLCKHFLLKLTEDVITS